MKKRFYIKSAMLSLMVATLFSSCLKDDTRYVNFAGSPPLVELPAATGVGPNGGGLVVQALNIASTPTPINVLVNVAAPKPLTTALTVTLSVDQSALNTYNAANGTSYVLLPAADYTSSLTTTIPANQNSANVILNINTSLIDPSKQYILPLTITNASGQQISNYKTVLYNIQAKNKYDGTYKNNAYVLRAGDNVLTGNFSGIATPLATSGGNSVGFTQIWGDGKTIVAGINPVILTVDPATNNVTVSSNINATLVGDPSYPNRYVPATKTFYVSYYWNAGKTSRAATDTLTYTGSR